MVRALARWMVALSALCMGACSATEPPAGVPGPPVDAALDFDGVIEGTVRGPDGEPLAGAHVVCRNKPPQRTPNRLAPVTSHWHGRAWGGLPPVEETVAKATEQAHEARRRLRVAETDAAGRFRIGGIRDGKVVLEAYAENVKFDPQHCVPGDEVAFEGKRVHEIAFDLTMQDGIAPESAILHLEHRGDDFTGSTNFTWTPDQPAIRTHWEHFVVTALTGDARREQRAVVGDGASSPLAIDVERHGLGPHPLVVVEAQVLEVEVTDALREARPRAASIKIARGEVADTFHWRDRRVLSIDSPYPGPLKVNGLEPGAYTLAFLPDPWSPPTTKVIQVGVGQTAVDLVVPAPRQEDHLVVNCAGPDGRPLDDVTFHARRRGARGGSSGALEGLDLGAPGETWVPWASLLAGEPRNTLERLVLTVNATGLGSRVMVIGEHESRVAIPFAEPGALTVSVTGANPEQFRVDVTLLAETKDGRAPRSSERPAPLGPSHPFDRAGKARIEALQPGRYQLAVTRRPPRMSYDLEPSRSVLILETVTVQADENAVIFDLPVLHELIVVDRDGEPGKAYTLSRGVGTAEQRIYHGTSAESGQAVFPYLTAGEYELRQRGRPREVMDVTVPCGPITFDPRIHNALLVGTVTLGGRASTAGFRRGDIIVGVDGVCIPSARRLEDRLFHGLNAPLDVRILRNGLPMTLEAVRLGGNRASARTAGMGATPIVLP